MAQMNADGRFAEIRNLKPRNKRQRQKDGGKRIGAQDDPQISRMDADGRKPTSWLYVGAFKNTAIWCNLVQFAATKSKPEPKGKGNKMGAKIRAQDWRNDFFFIFLPHKTMLETSTWIYLDFVDLLGFSP